MKKKEKTSKLILETAWKLFNEQGYSETTTRQISEQAGIATGTVFSHFPTKLDMLKTAMYLQLEVIISQAAKSDEQHTARLKLRHYAKYLYAFYLDNREFSKELLTHLVWQKSFFEGQLDEFKKRLFSEQNFDQVKSDVMMDCYFMTLMQGLADEQSTVDGMIRNLTTKLQLIPSSAHLPN